MDARREERVPLVGTPATSREAPVEKYGSSPPINPNVDSTTVEIKTEETNGGHFDYVIVVPNGVSPNGASMTKQDVLNRLNLAGLIVQQVESASGTFIKIRADVARLQKEAARVKLPVLLNETKLEEIAKTGLRAFHIEPFEVENPPRKWIDLFKRPIYAPYASIHMPYAKEIDQSLYATHRGSFFSNIHRMQLIESILTNVNGGGAGLDLEKLTSDGVILACYPLHNLRQRNALEKAWMAWCYAPWQQPLEDIKDYFGPKIALYFAFLGHYTTYVLWASLVGVLVTAMQLSPSNVTKYVPGSAITFILPIFGVGMLLWASFFLKHWKRRNSVLAMEWGMSDFDKENKDVILFHNRPNTWVENIFRLGGSWLVVIVLVGLIFAAVIALARVYELPLAANWLNGNINLLAILVVVQIISLSAFFQWLCIILTNYENHPTESKYEFSCIMKLVVFELANHFAALAYFCFFVAINPSEFAWLVYRVYGAYIVIDHIQMFFLRSRQHPENGQIYQSGEEMESQFILSEYGWKQDTMNHLKLILHFAHLTIFAVLCPLNPFLSFIHYSLEIRLNGKKLIQFCRRPRPRGAESLGIWYAILDSILNIAICTNAWLMVALTPNEPATANGLPVSTHNAVFSLILLLVVCRILIIVGYQDTPSRIRLQLERQVYYVAKLYFKAFGWPEHANLSNENSKSSYEFCLAFPNPEGLVSATDKNAMANVLNKLRKANIQYKVYPSTVKSSKYLSSFIFCEIRASEAQLQQEAARIQLPMLLDEIMLREKAHEGVFKALYDGMVDIVDRLRVEATRVNLTFLIENMMTQPTFLANSHTNDDLADKIEKILATINYREPRSRVCLKEVLADLKNEIEVDIEGEQFRLLDAPQTLLNKIEKFLQEEDIGKSKQSSKKVKLERSKAIDQLIDETVKSLHDQSLNTLYMAQREWNFGLDRVLWLIEEFLRQSDVSALELTSPDSSLKWLTMDQYLSSFNSDILYPKLSEILIECMSLLQVQGSTPYQAFQEFRVKHPTSIVLDLVSALEASIIANPDIEILPFYLGNPDPKYNLLAKRFKYHPYQYLHMPYRRQLGKWQEVYATPSAYSNFTPIQRMMLIESMLQTNIELEELLAKNVISGAFPLHNRSDVELLSKKWISWSFAQPLEQIHDYFGVNVAMYFAHLGHATKWLTFATVLGALFFVWQTMYSFSNLELYVVPSFGVCMILWATLWLKHWTRSLVILKLKWGLPLNEAKRPSPVRGAYTGDYIRNPITGLKVKYFQRNSRLVRWVLGWLLFSFFLAFAVGGQVLILYIALQNTGNENISIFTAIAVGLWILCMKNLFNRYCIWLINYENHRTEASHESAYVIKASLFHAFNSFATLLYILKDQQLRNRNSLYIIYGVELFSTHISSLLRLFFQSNGSNAEEQYFQEEYNWSKSTERHFDRVIHFGYMIGGVVVCPLAPALAFLDHILTIRLQATQFLSSSRRPRPTRITDTWYLTLMNIVLVCAIVSNSYLVIYVVKTFGPASIFSTFDGFCGILLGLVVFRQFFNSIINDVPTRVNSQLERQKFVVESILQDKPFAVMSKDPSTNGTIPAMSGISHSESINDEVDERPGDMEEGFV